MRAPEFWWHEHPSALAHLLSPLGQVFGAVTRARMRQQGTRLSVPVVCIGNFVAGGAGKTPTAIALARLLDEHGEAPYFLSRGYGAAARPQAGPILVDPAKHSAQEVGDEPLLLARHAPTVVAADRLAGARAAIKAGASILVMDDGLQNPALHKDLSIAVVDSDAGVGNGLCIPAGPLRAPLADQFIGVDALVIVGEGPRAKEPMLMARQRALPVIEAMLEPDAAGRARLARQKVVAFAGIGRPEKFFRTLRELGANVAQALPFPDHHPYGSADISMLKSAARQAGAMLVTTEKDYVRLQHLKDLPPIDTLAVTLETRQSQAFGPLLDDLLKA